MKRLAQFGVAVLFSAFSGLVLAHGKAHVHGKGEMELVVDGGRLSFALVIPMESLVGFEHMPKSDAQRAALVELRDRLGRPEQMLQPNAEGRCIVAESSFESPLLAALKGASGKGGEHSDLNYKVTFQCAEPMKLRTIDLGIMRQHKRLSTLDVQLAGDRGQRATSVRARNPILPL